jgi:anti-sigma regulatory factor (Ser/Thr protein kinase)
LGIADEDPMSHIEQREKEGMRAGGYGLLLAAGTVDELIFSEIGNEVLLIKYLDSSTGGDSAKGQ